jgi:hypothetical protein
MLPMRRTTIRELDHVEQTNTTELQRVSLPAKGYIIKSRVATDSETWPSTKKVRHERDKSYKNNVLTVRIIWILNMDTH